MSACVNVMCGKTSLGPVSNDMICISSRPKSDIKSDFTTFHPNTFKCFEEEASYLGQHPR